MSGLATYREENRQTSALCGYGARQAGAQGYLTNTQVNAATTLQELIDDVTAAVVAPGAASPSQRDSILRCLREGGQLGDWSDARVATATTVTELANLTWVSDDPDTTHLGTNLTP